MDIFGFRKENRSQFSRTDRELEHGRSIKTQETGFYDRRITTSGFLRDLENFTIAAKDHLMFGNNGYDFLFKLLIQIVFDEHSSCLNVRL